MWQTVGCTINLIKVYFILTICQSLLAETVTTVNMGLKRTEQKLHYEMSISFCLSLVQSCVIDLTQYGEVATSFNTASLLFHTPPWLLALWFFILEPQPQVSMLFYIYLYLISYTHIYIDFSGMIIRSCIFFAGELHIYESLYHYIKHLSKHSQWLTP